MCTSLGERVIVSPEGTTGQAISTAPNPGQSGGSEPHPRAAHRVLVAGVTRRLPRAVFAVEPFEGDDSDRDPSAAFRAAVDGANAGPDRDGEGRGTTGVEGTAGDVDDGVWSPPRSTDPALIRSLSRTSYSAQRQTCELWRHDHGQEGWLDCGRRLRAP